MVYVGRDWDVDERWMILSDYMLRLLEYSWGRRVVDMSEALPLLMEKKRRDEHLETMWLLEQLDDEEEW